MNSIKVFAPATVANVACGFDVLGFAVENPGDEVIMRQREKPGVEIVEITGDEGRLSKDPHSNTVGVSVLNYLNHIGKPDLGIEITLHKKMPFGSGLGSSAASTVAGVFAVNELLGAPMTREDLLPFAMEGERIACGSAHADNVAPALYGGVVLVRSYSPLDVVRLNTPNDLYCTIIHPQIEVPTKDARAILRKEVTLEKAIIQWGNVAGLVAGLEKEDYDLIGRSIKDVIVEPVRSLLIPGYDRVKQSAIDTGVLGTSISGSGPSIFSLCKGEETALKAGKAKQEVFAEMGIKTSVFTSEVNQVGPKVLD